MSENQGEQNREGRSPQDGDVPESYAAPDTGTTRPLPQYGQYAPTFPPVPPSTGQGSQGAGQAPYPGHAGYSQNPQSGYSQNQHDGYPSAPSYPHTLAPAVTTRDRKKVGLGTFAAGIIVAALIGGGVGGGTSYLLQSQNGGAVAAPAQQTSQVIVNDKSDVNAVTAAASKASPSVVTISATSGNSGGTGSGIILDKEGHILTNTHVVTLDGQAAHATIEVQLSDGKAYAGTVVGTDPLSDLAVVKINAPNLIPAALGDSSKINVGDTVIAIGAPLGLSGTVTDGIVSTLNRTIQVASSAVPKDQSDTPGQGGNGFRFSPPDGSNGSQSAAQGTVNLNVIQTDAAINPGNSGGALVNTDGQVVGVNVAIASAGSSGSGGQTGNIGVGFSIPIDTAKRISSELIANGKATHGQLGVSVQDATANGNSGFSTGASIAAVTPGSPAAKAGLKVGDVVIGFGQRTIIDGSSLTAAVREQAGGATVKATFVRNGQQQSVDVTLGSVSE